MRIYRERRLPERVPEHYVRCLAAHARQSRKLFEGLGYAPAELFDDFHARAPYALGLVAVEVYGAEVAFKLRGVSAFEVGGCPVFFEKGFSDLVYELVCCLGDRK